MQPISDLLTGGYAQTRQLARAGDSRALAEVARQFEAYFLQQVLKSMRDASFGDPMFGSETGKFYREMMDQQLSLQLSSGEGIGLAKVLKRQIGAYVGAAEAPQGGGSDLGKPTSHQGAANNPARAQDLGARARLHRAASASPTVAPLPHLPAGEYRSVAVAAANTVNPSREPRFGSPQAFVETLWPHAKRAAAALNVSPRTLLAQSALETGWGRHVMPGPDGAKSSYNLFGIKADGRWHGPRVVKQTMEYDAGVMKRVKAPFRAYANAAESFNDYVRFIQSNPRYRDALLDQRGPECYLRGLQDAGYATDPEYANKVLRLLQRAPFRPPQSRS